MLKKRKFIVVTGGVLSGLGKGIAAASIGHVLSSQYRVVPIKLDGYLNVDPGTMNPYEHGEVFVLDDGGEVDMDFGHYERFLNVSCKFEHNLTMGKVFEEIRSKERRGDYLGKTVQFVPHVVDVIKGRIFSVAEKEQAEIMLIEVGGTVGDMESDLYIEAMRQLENDVGEENILYVHLTYVPIPAGVAEQKSKPTQQSVYELRKRGIQPDVIIGRCSEPLTPEIKSKIASFCGVDKKAIFTGLDVDNVYKIPFLLEEEGIVEILKEKLGLEFRKIDDLWKELLHNLENPIQEITVALCGKYTSLTDSYASIKEALMHCSAHTKARVNMKFIETTAIEEGRLSIGEALAGVDGVIVPGGFGSRGVEGKLEVVRYCRENKIPILGICFGLQLMVVEFARNVCLLEKANTTEVDPETTHPVVDLMSEQKGIEAKGATMRLGAYISYLREGSLVRKLYNSEIVSERHRHRYEVNRQYHQFLQENGLSISGLYLEKNLAEFIELRDHPYFIATQAHPELKSRLSNPAPLFLGLVKAAMEKK
ncbi:CTP synthase (glutamine hydrolyzing) [Candidatus Woesearchaeota archaeon]|nr:CTP synthase (glutamine hydrolyzing) [Candidatus Woesearchaeota archaeon]